MTALSLTRLVFNSNLETSVVNNVFAQIEDFLNGVTLTANITITGTLTAATINSTSLTASRALASDASKNIVVSATTSTELGYVNGVTSAIQTQLNNKQTLDATLTALAAYNTNGLLTQTAADTFTGRTITGTAGTITVTNGDGVSGNPTLTISSSYIGQSSITTLGTIGTGVWQGTLVGATYGGTGVNNGASTITLAGNLVTAGAFSLTLTTSAATNVTLPTSGTLVNSAVATLSSLTSVGTIGTGVWQGTLVGATYGGTGVNNGASTITLAGNLVTAGAFSLTLTTSAATNVTLPTSGTLVNSAVTTLSSLTSVGTIGTGVWQGTLVGAAYGGTGMNNGASTLTLGVSTTITAAAATVLDDTTVSAMVDTIGGASATGTGGLVRSVAPTLTAAYIIQNSGAPQLQVGRSVNNGIFINGQGGAAHYNFSIAQQNNVDGGLEFTPSTTVGGTTFSTPAMVVLRTGNVGIKNAAPGVLLQVGAGSAANIPISTSTTVVPQAFSSTTSGASAIGVMVSDGVNNRRAGLFANDTNGTFGISGTYSSGAPDFVILIDTVEGMRIKSDGKVGIGTTDPGAALHIGGTGTIRINGATSGTGTAAIIDANGDIRPLTSSERYKENIINLSIDSSFIHKLRSVEYDYINGAGHDFGLIAEEVNELCPLMVNFNTEGEPESVKYSQLTIFLLEEVKRLRVELDFMKIYMNYG